VLCQCDCLCTAGCWGRACGACAEHVCDRVRKHIAFGNLQFAVTTLMYPSCTICCLLRAAGDERAALALALDFAVTLSTCFANASLYNLLYPANCWGRACGACTGHVCLPCAQVHQHLALCSRDIHVFFQLICCFLQAAGDERAALALDMFVYRVRKYICMYQLAVTILRYPTSTICCLLRAAGDERAALALALDFAVTLSTCCANASMYILLLPAGCWGRACSACTGYVCVPRAQVHWGVQCSTQRAR
jgi:hypothetical protein